MSHLDPDLLSALVDGEVGVEERRDAHAHLQECASCRQTLESYGAVRRMVADLPRLAAPESIVAAALAPETGAAAFVRRTFRGPRRYVAAGLAAAALAVTVAGVAVPADEQRAPVDVFVARHAGVSAGNSVSGQVIFAVTGR